VAWRSVEETETQRSRRRDLRAASAADRQGDNRSVGTGRRRALPAGRAVVGGFLVAVAAVNVFAASLAGASHPGQRWVVATRPLRAGSVLGPGDLTTASMRLSAGPAGLAFRQTGSVEGRAVAIGLQAGELIQAPMLVPSSQEPPLRPVSLAVDPVSLAGLSAGQPVDVLVTEGTGSGTAVVVVVRGARLLDVATAGSSLLAPGGAGQVTIGVDTLAEVEAVVQAAHAGTVTLVAAERNDGVGPGPGGAGS
jgi:hypothetical protein